MTAEALIDNRYYVQTVTGVAVFIAIIGVLVFLMQMKDPKWIGVWAALKSWLFTAPFIFFFLALPSPWPLVFLVLVSIAGAKSFFRMTGMYHRSWYVWTTYLFLALQGYLIFNNYDRFFNIVPMIFFGAITLIPLLRNSATQMVQYMALTLMNFIFMGWGFMYMGRILMWEGGALLVLYITIVSELCGSSNYIFSRVIGKHRPLENITSRFTVEGFLGSIVISVAVAWGLRHMLPDRSQTYWLTAGLIIAVFGRAGSLMLSVIRRDLGVKDSGIFIIGRDDILARIDSIMFAAPAIYFAFRLLQGFIEL